MVRERWSVPCWQKRLTTEPQSHRANGTVLTAVPHALQREPVLMTG
jgi:hypothetical protein